MDYLAQKLNVRKSILYLLLLILIIASYNLIIKKEITYIKETKAKITELDNELTVIEEKVKGISSNQLREMEHRAQEFKKQYDLGLESQLVLLDVTKYAQDADLDIIEFASQEKIDFQDFKHRKYSVALKGDYQQFLHWLKLMEQMPYYINIEDLLISKYLIAEENRTFAKPTKQLVYKVTINNIALDGSLRYEQAEPEYFREDPFKPGILNSN